MRLAWWVNHSCEEIFFNNFTRVNVTEGGNLLTMLVALNLDHLPSEEDFNTSFLALIEGNLVSVGELENLLVWCPVLNAGVLSGTSLKHVLAEEVFIVEGIEI